MELTFEQAMKRLDEISTSLSGDTLSLDMSLELYAEGVKLIKLCSEKLSQATLTVKSIEEGETI